ncbi:MAG: methionyl-tRNA formyltransferase [Verrucomicrobia bacterium]|nr:methionyl-tRNA formyltransferase [Verrucomicrobiota bacterium]MCH8514647.1 methionyl-tRNA formyltransferase [Kiritimatiellia bacterium]
MNPLPHPLPVVYLGTAEIAVPAMEAIAGHPDFDLKGVFSQPDRPSGRHRRLTASPAKSRARELSVPVATPEKIGEAQDQLEAWNPSIMVVFAYGQYIPRRVFAFPPLGTINLHPSLLPKYRGASPIQSAIAAGESESGLSVIRVTERMDAGDILLQRRVEIGPMDTAQSMSERFAAMSAELIVEALLAIRDGNAVWVPQDEDRVVECGKLSKEDGWMDWTLPAQTWGNRIRAYQPWPGVSFPLPDGSRVKIHAARLEEGGGAPGEVLDVGTDGPLIACGDGALRLTQVQPPGKSVMSGRDFLNGHPLQCGEKLPND